MLTANILAHEFRYAHVNKTPVKIITMSHAHLDMKLLTDSQMTKESRNKAITHNKLDQPH